ncbi:unnamed protein product, partial [Rotaria magnacalcarata]
TDAMKHATDAVTGKSREFAQGAAAKSKQAEQKASHGFSALRKSIEGIFH